MASSSESRRGIRLSATLPVLAETDAVREVVEGLLRLVGDELHEVVIVISRFSPPESQATCEALATTHTAVKVSEQLEYPGLGFAVRQGIEECTGSHILLMDSDGEMDVETVPSMLHALKAGDLDLVVASRWMEGGGVEGYDSLKYYLNFFYQKLFGALYRTPITDLTLGFKLGRAEVLQGFRWRGQFHEIGCETTLRPIRAGCRVGQVPTVWRCRKQGVSNNSFPRNFRYVGMASSILVGRGAPRRVPGVAS